MVSIHSIFERLGSEPVVSAFYVMNTDQKGGDFQIKPKDKIMILDCGGGTIDASCIEITSKSHDLAELHHGDGIRAGGLDIDTKFMKLLKELLPQDITGTLSFDAVQVSVGMCSFAMEMTTKVRGLQSPNT